MTRLPDESISFQNTTGDSGMENLYIYGKLNYNFENDDITSKSINAGSGQFNNISLNTINATSHITTTATITALDLTATNNLSVTNNVSVGSSVTAGSFYGDGSNLTGIEAFVKGMIILWYGSTSNVPSGWVLCDNSTAAQNAGAPDLRDKFVVGAGNNYAVDATGGSADAVVVEHKHVTTFDGHKFFPGDGSTSISYGGPGGYPATVFNMDNEGVSGTNKNLPPYYALCYIMKT